MSIRSQKCSRLPNGPSSWPATLGIATAAIATLASACTESSQRAPGAPLVYCSNQDFEDSRFLRLPHCFKYYPKNVIVRRCLVRQDRGPVYFPIKPCLEALPARELSGYWLSGFETSVFAKLPSDLYDPNLDGLGTYHFMFRNGADQSEKLRGLPQVGETPRVYAVKFRGALLENANDPYLNTVYVHQLQDLRQIHDSKERPPTESPNDRMQRAGSP